MILEPNFKRVAQYQNLTKLSLVPEHKVFLNNGGLVLQPNKEDERYCLWVYTDAIPLSYQQTETNYL